MPEAAEGATDFVVAGDTVLAAARAEVQAAELADDHERMAHAYMDLHDAGEHDARARAQALILGLGFQVHELDRPVNEFSGGWRMRLQLARALMCPADLLLLDEPTNHLDLDALVWLEAWLTRFAGTIIVISHDRDFLDAVTQVTLHIEHQKLNRYGGNYSQFESMRAERASQQRQAFAKQQEQIAHLQKFIDRFKAKASKAKQAQSRVKALERMERVAPLLAEADFSFSFEEPANLPNPMLALRDVSAGYATHPILQGLDCSVWAGQRIGILGANGQGKSTLVKTVAASIDALGGEITRGKGLNIGYFAQQELDVLRPADSPLEHMVALARSLAADQRLQGQSTREQDLRNFLGGFNFSADMVLQAVGSMSGGEKARLVLCMLVWQRPNLLLLDEPTNHLDLATREALSVALNEFEGTVMLVSHDRAMLRSVCDEFWLVSAGQVRPFDGDLDDYQRWLATEAKRKRDALQASTAATAIPKPAPAAPAAATTRTRPAKTVQKECADAEAQVMRLQAACELWEGKLAEAAPDDIAALGQTLSGLHRELAAHEERWLQLMAELESAAA
jgi:ATP-binding cassette subfamily F protein 3